MTKNSKNKQNKKLYSNSYVILREMRFLIPIFLLLSSLVIAEDKANDQTLAQSGDEVAQFNLSYDYYNGIGVEEDYELAFY